MLTSVYKGLPLKAPDAAGQRTQRPHKLLAGLGGGVGRQTIADTTLRRALSSDLSAPVHRGTQDSGRLRVQEAKGLGSASGQLHLLSWVQRINRKQPRMEKLLPSQQRPQAWNQHPGHQL